MNLLSSLCWAPPLFHTHFLRSMSKRSIRDVTPDLVGSPSESRPPTREELIQYLENLDEVQQDFVLDIPEHPNLQLAKEGHGPLEWMDILQAELEAVVTAAGLQPTWEDDDIEQVSGCSHLEGRDQKNS
jgi:hypothetical protein